MVENSQSSLLGKIAAYTEILSTDPRSTIFVSLSESYRKMGMFDDALSVAVKGLEELPDYGPGHVVLARIKCQLGDLKASGNAFNTAIELDPNNLAALVGFSRLYLLQGRESEARELLLKARELSPADSVINKLLLSLPEPVSPAEVEEETDNPADEIHFKTVEEPKAEPFESATLADLYLKQGMADKALDIYRSLLTQDPDNLEFRRRIRDIEMLNPAIIDTQTKMPDVDSVENQTENRLEDDDVDISASSIPEIEVEQSTCSGEQLSTLDQLNRLLGSIQKRRGDV